MYRELAKVRPGLYKAIVRPGHRDSFEKTYAETFDVEVAFIWRQLRNKGVLSPHEGLIVELLETVFYDNADLLFCPFLVAEAISYQDTFPAPFCSDEYDKPLEPVVVRISGIDNVYRATMGGN